MRRTQRIGPGTLLVGGALMVFGAILVEVNMRADVPLGSRLWFLGIGAFGVVELVWGGLRYVGSRRQRG